MRVRQSSSRGLRAIVAPILSLGCALALFVPAPARADVTDTDKGTARQLTVDGFAALDRKDFEAAADLFRRADSLYDAPMITLGYARAQAGLGKLVSAQELYNELTHQELLPNASPTVVKAIADGKEELRLLEPRVPFVIIAVEGSEEAVVTLDGGRVPSGALGVKRPVDPGRHVVTATADGFAVESATIMVEEGESERVTLRLQALPPGVAPSAVRTEPDPAVGGGEPPTTPPPTDPGRAQRIAGLTIGGAGVATLVVSGITGGLALAGQAPAGTCKPAGNSLLCSEAGFGEQTSARDLAWVSTATLVVGGALAIGGLVVTLTAPRPSKRGTSSSRIRVAPLGVTWEGSF